MADYPISNVPRRIVFAADGVGPYAFTFEILTQTDIAVFKDDDLLELTTDYSVTINPDGTGSVLLNVAPVGATQIALVGARAIERVSDFTTGGDFFAATVNEELDSLTIFAQQNAEAVDRALKAPQTDSLTIDMTLPRAAERAGKFLAFDSLGNPVPGAVPPEIQQVLAIEDEIVAVAAVDDEIVAVAGGLGTDQDITVVADDLRGANTIGTVATNIANVNIVGGNTANIDAVAAELGTDLDVTVVADDLRGPNNIGAVGANIADVTEVAANIGTDLPVTVIAADLTGSDTIGTVSANIADVVEVGANIADVTKVANIDDDVVTVAAIEADVTIVAGIATDVTTVAGIAADIPAAAAIDAADLSAVAAISGDVTTVAGISANVTTVAGISADVTAVAADAADIGTVAGIAADVTTVAGVSTDVTTVAGVAADVGIVATNVADVTNFADVYQGGKATDPTLRNDGSALQSGDLYFNTVDNVMKTYDGSSWTIAFVPSDGFLIAANNLSDLSDDAAARTNLGLDALATKSTVDTADIEDAAVTVDKLAASLDFGSIA
jgi:hypothetical protein